MAKRFTKKQREFFKAYEAATTFDAMYMEDVLAGNMTFEEAARRNCDWFEDWASDALRGATAARDIACPIT